MRIEFEVWNIGCGSCGGMKIVRNKSGFELADAKMKLMIKLMGIK